MAIESLVALNIFVLFWLRSLTSAPVKKSRGVNDPLRTRKTSLNLQVCDVAISFNQLIAHGNHPLEGNICLLQRSHYLFK